MRNPILHVFLHCKDLKNPYSRWLPDAIFKEIFFNSLYAMENDKICLLRRFLVCWNNPECSLK